jgi:hypothetical protein
MKAWRRISKIGSTRKMKVVSFCAGGPPLRNGLRRVRIDGEIEESDLAIPVPPVPIEVDTEQRGVVLDRR